MTAPPIFRARGNGAELRPHNEAQADLVCGVADHVSAMSHKADEYRLALEAEHRSEFNPFLLYTGRVSYSERCDASGAPTADGRFYRGVRGSLESSLEPHNDYFTIDRVGDSGEVVVHLGERRRDEQSGILVDTRYPYNQFRLTKQIAGALRRAGLEYEIVQNATATDSALKAWTTRASVGEGLDALDIIATKYLSRVAIEGKFFNLFRQRPNMVEVHDDNLSEYVRVEGEEKDDYPENLLLITATRICRRCRAGFQELFTNYTASHPEITFGIAFTDKPKIKFMPVVFEGHCGGVRLSGFVTPFIIPYKNGVYQGRYLASRRQDPPPNTRDIDKLVGQYFG